MCFIKNIGLSLILSINLVSLFSFYETLELA